MSMASPVTINVERPHKEPAGLRGEVADAVKRAKSWAELLHIADESRDQFRIRQARALYRKGREIYPEHENEFQIGENFIRTRRQVEREERQRERISREVAEALQSATTHKEAVGIAWDYVDKMRFAHMQETCMQAARKFPEHREEIERAQTVMVSQYQHTARASGYTIKRR